MDRLGGGLAVDDLALVEARGVARILPGHGPVVADPYAVLAGYRRHSLERLDQVRDALAAGEVVLAGSFTRPMHVSAGDTVTADYGPLGTVTCFFA